MALSALVVRLYGAVVVLLFCACAATVAIGSGPVGLREVCTAAMRYGSCSRLVNLNCRLTPRDLGSNGSGLGCPAKVVFGMTSSTTPHCGLRRSQDERRTATISGRRFRVRWRRRAVAAVRVRLVRSHCSAIRRHGRRMRSERCGAPVANVLRPRKRVMLPACFR